MTDSTNTASKVYPPVEVLLPHSHPMILVDKLVSAELDKITASVTLRPDSPLMQNGTVPALVSIEYMAQSIGLLTGYESYKRNCPVQVGYLLGARSLDLAVDHFSDGDELIIEVTRIFGEDELGAFQCRVSRNGETMASAVLNVYRNKEYVIPGRN